MKKLLFVIAILSTNFLVAQSPSYQWARSAGTECYGIATQTNGAVISVGRFNTTIDFDPGPGVFTITPVAGNDAYVLQLDSSGNFMWAAIFSGPADQAAYSISLDNNSNIYLSGNSTGAFMDADPGPGTYTVGPGSSFIVKLNSSGNFIWATASSGGMGKCVRVGPDGFLYWTGNAGITKFDLNGNVIWMYPVGMVVNGVAADASGNVYATGNAGGGIDYDAGPGTYTLTGYGNVDIAIIKIDALGNFLWARSMGGTMDDVGNGITIDQANNLIITGHFRYLVDFDPGPATFYLNAGPCPDIHVTKFDSNGNFIWAGNVAGNSSNTDAGLGIASDNFSNIYVTGYFQGTGDFDMAISQFYNMTVSWSTENFILKLNSSCSFVWAKKFNGTMGNAICVDPTGTTIYTGGWWGSGAPFDVDPDPPFQFFINPLGVYGYIHKLGSCHQPPTPFDITPLSNLSICPGFTTNLSVSGGLAMMGCTQWYTTPTSTLSINNNTNYFISNTLTPGTYTMYAEAKTCTVSNRTPVTFTVNPTPTITTVYTSTLCLGDSFTIVPGGASTYTIQGGNSVVTPTSDVSYTVIGTSSAGCVSTSPGTVNIQIVLCFETGFTQNEINNFFVGPNPTNGFLKLKLPKPCTLEIITVDGRIIQSESFEAGSHAIDMSKFLQGVYLIKIKSGELKHVSRIIKDQ